MESLMFMVVLLGIGWLLRSLNAPIDFAKSLNFFIIHISLPATIFLQIPAIEFSVNSLNVILAPWLLLLITATLVWWLTRGQPSGVRAALMLLVPLGNTSFLGIPMIEALVGPSVLGYVVLYDQFGTFLILATYGSFIIAHQQDGHLNWKIVFKKLVTFPPFLALIFILLWGKMPDLTLPYLKQLSSTLIPLALISVGYTIEVSKSLKYSLLSFGLVMKLLVTPIIAIGILAFFNVDPMIKETIVLEAAMPSMITAGALAISAGFAPALSAAIVGYGVILSMVSVPFWHWIITRL